MSFKSCKCLIKKGVEEGCIKYDHPVIIVILGHLAIFLLAIPYYCKFNLYSLFNIFLMVLLYILFFSMPFIVGCFLKFYNNNSKKYLLNLYHKVFYNPYLYALLMFIFIFYGVYVVNKSIFLSFIYPLIVIFILSIYGKYSNNGFININNNFKDNNNNFKNNKNNINNTNDFNNFNNNFKNKLNYILTQISKYINDIIFIIGIISFILIVVLYGGIPLFNYDIRMRISSDPLRLISTGALVYAGLNNFKYFLASFLIMILLGYKAGVLILCASYIIYLYRTKKISTKYLFISFIGLLGILAIMAKVILMFSNQNWKVNVLGILSYRAYFDMTVLDKIINYGSHTWGGIVFNPVGEKFIGKLLFEYTHNMTATLFGPIYLDFGYYGLIFATLLGIGSKIIYENENNKKIYSIYAAILLTMCEIGINYGFLIVFLVLLYVVSLNKYFLKNIDDK